MSSIELLSGGVRLFINPRICNVIELLPPNFHFLSRMKMKRVSKQVLEECPQGDPLSWENGLENVITSILLFTDVSIRRKAEGYFPLSFN